MCNCCLQRFSPKLSIIPKMLMFQHKQWHSPLLWCNFQLWDADSFKDMALQTCKNNTYVTVTRSLVYYSLYIFTWLNIEIPLFMCIFMKTISQPIAKWNFKITALLQILIITRQRHVARFLIPTLPSYIFHIWGCHLQLLYESRCLINEINHSFPQKQTIICNTAQFLSEVSI